MEVAGTSFGSFALMFFQAAGALPFKDSRQIAGILANCGECFRDCKALRVCMLYFTLSTWPMVMRSVELILLRRRSVVVEIP